MPGLRFFSCDQCGTVHAEPLVPERCRQCQADALVDITGRLQDERYFTRPPRS